ncbi:MAG: lipoate--protein ligase family protein [Deltaproteobacteria bacterium]|nr:lipoate--protein ligase family protein [Deltaproteobacteria bacterium]
MDNWGLIMDAPSSGALNMAVDEAMLAALEAGAASGPSLRLYGWSEPAVSIGRNQDATAFAGTGMPVVRRITGGRAVLHDAEVTYSIVCPARHPLFDNGIAGAYKVISGCIIEALRGAGIHAELARPERASGTKARDACFISPSRYEVMVDGRKLAGSAQRRLKSAFLQHGSILLGVDAEALGRVFGEEAACALMKKIAWVGAYSPIDADGLRGLLLRGFRDGLSARFNERHLSGAEEYARDGILKNGIEGTAPMTRTV